MTIRKFNESFFHLVFNTSCSRHGKDVDEPCWSFSRADGSIARGICDYRARKVGLVGTISDQALQKKGRGRA